MPTRLAVVFATILIIFMLSTMLFWETVFFSSIVRRHSLRSDEILSYSVSNAWIFQSNGIDHLEAIRFDLTRSDFSALVNDLGCTRSTFLRSSLNNIGTFRLWWHPDEFHHYKLMICDDARSFIDLAVDAVDDNRVRVWIKIYTL